MTPREQTALLACYTLWEKDNNVDFEDLLEALAASFREQAARETHPEVRACLESVAEHLSFASVDFYASTK